MSTFILRIAALLLLLAATGLWLASGMNRGWTKTSVPRTIHDDVTGLDGVSYEKHFVPGVDFLGAATLTTGALFGVSFLFRKNNRKPHIDPNRTLTT